VKTFDRKEAISFGWNVSKANWRFFVPLLLIVWAITNGIPQLLGRNVTPHSLASYLLFIISTLINLIINIGLLKISLKLIDKKKPEFKDLYSESNLALRYIGATLLYYLIVAGGLILLIVPGIILAIKFGYYKYFIVDKNMGIMESLRESSKITQGNKWNLFRFDLSLVGINILGVLALFLGLFLTLPLSMVSSAWVYRKLSR
jgi:uncharacterized membrane protein